MDPETPTFNLKAVVQETGIKPDTLRAWERRYGLPEPDRSPGGHRLYSQRDIDTLIWLMARQDEGLTISRAVDLWRSIEEEGRDPLLVPEYSVHTSQTPNVQGEEVQSIRNRWIKACMDFDEQSADRILAQAFAVYPVETVCIDILQTGLRMIGELWYDGDVNVQQEHFASALAMRRIDAMLGASPLPTRPGRILIACPPGEEHVFGQALLQLLLRRRGWETVYLGANVPLDRLESSIEMVRPHLVILSAQLLQTAASLQEMAGVLNQKGVPVSFGGRVFTKLPSLRKRIQGHYLGDTLKDALDKVEELIPVPPPLDEPKPLQSQNRDALAHFQDRAFDISARVNALMNANDLSAPKLTKINLDLQQNIVAALKLDDITLLDEDIAWIRGLLINYKVPPDTLGDYLRTYHQAAEQSLADKAKPVVDWLSDISHHLDAIHENGNHLRKNHGSSNGFRP